ncbi:MAG TPA: hypothetical protein VK709_12225 [Candidatus Saccharimonadales bacterium]|nr:hypothetical protein [Candidatus Saccharimonadales bacterium]
MIGVELPRYFLQALPCRIQFKNLAHNRSFRFVNLKARAVQILPRPVPEAPPACVQSSAEQALHSPAHPVCRIAQEKLVDEAARHQEELELLIRAVDTLRDETNFHTGEIEPLA